MTWGTSHGLNRTYQGGQGDVPPPPNIVCIFPYLSARAIAADFASRTETRRNAFGHFCE